MGLVAKLSVLLKTTALGTMFVIKPMERKYVQADGVGQIATQEVYLRESTPSAPCMAVKTMANALTADAAVNITILVKTVRLNLSVV
jgi:hypothetical protein